MSKVRLGKRERQAKKAFNEAILVRNQAVVSHNLSQPKPRPEAISYVATRSGFVRRDRDETAMLKANCHTRGISIGSQLSRAQSGYERGPVKHHPKIGQLGAWKDKR